MASGQHEQQLGVSFVLALVLMTHHSFDVAVRGHILDAILKYYTAWLEAGSPMDGVQVDMGPMVPIARGEHVFPPNAPAAATSSMIRNIITECEDAVVETGMTKSCCSEEVVRVRLLPTKSLRGLIVCVRRNDCNWHI
jgi:hypothetical protein